MHINVLVMVFIAKSNYQIIYIITNFKVFEILILILKNPRTVKVENPRTQIGPYKIREDKKISSLVNEHSLSQDAKYQYLNLGLHPPSS